MRPVLLAAAVLAVAASAAAQPRTQTAFDLVRLDASARSAALGGPAALADDPVSVFANPAFLTPEASGAVALGYTNLVADVNAGSAAYARDLGAQTVGVAVRYLSYGEFERRESVGAEANGTYSASEAAVTVAASREVLPEVRVGLAAHGLFAGLDGGNAAALAADAGVSLAVPSQALRIGASVHHVGAVLSSLGAEADRLPLDVRLTVAKRLRYVPLTVSAAGVDLHRLGAEGAESSDPLDFLALGGELQLGRTFAVRAGYNGRRGADFRSGGRLDLAGVSAGAGIALRRVSVDYAFQNWGDFGGVHQFGVRTRL